MASLFSNYNNIDQSNSFNNAISPSLSQGTKFKKYQSKFNKKSKNPVNIIEGFEGEVVSFDEPIPNTDPSNNVLTTESKDIIENNTYIDDQAVKIEDLRKQYDATLKQYQDLMDKINKNTEDYLQRTKNNPYAGKNIRFTTGHVCYVTQQGIVMHIPYPEAWDSIAGKNGCPGKNYTDVGIKYPESNVPGTNIPELNLILGPPMKPGQSCSNAGKNIYVNKLLDNPKEKYIGCYSDKPPVSEILIVPVMNSSNSVGSFKSSASSIYLGNNGGFGPWRAFDRNPNTYWHSAVGGSYNYNGNTGVYTGGNNLTYKNYGQNLTAKGEFLWIEIGAGRPLTRYDVQGRHDCCGNPNARSPNSWVILGGLYNVGFELVDVRHDEKLNYEKRTYYVKNSKAYNYYVFLTTNCGNPGDRTGNRYCVQISSWDLYTSSEYGSNNTRAMLWEPNWIGYEDLETCKKYASENGYKYFGLQDGKSDGKAACLVSNDLSSVKKYGKAYDYKPIPLWHSNTAGKGTLAFLNNSCSLVVNDSSNKAIWATPNNTGLVGNYYGCYNDCYQGRGLPSHKGWANIDSCRDIAVKNKAKYYGLQWTQSNGQSECWIGNDLDRARMMGKANNCTKLNGNFVGGGCSNAVYSTNFDSNTIISSFLILQDDGNMCIYRGTSPNDNQGFIWGTSTNGRQKEKNSNFTAVKSKYGKNWIPNGITLAPGDWIGSNDGSIYLIMQTDGNLVLYTNERKEACFANSKGQMVGGGWVNAVYEFINSGNSGFKDNIGKLAYIDENDVLHEYNKDNTQLTNEYTKVSNYDAWGDDLPAAAYGNATQEQCKSTCDGRQDCYGYVFTNFNKTCYPKSSRMWPYGGKSRPLNGGDTYIRNKKPISVPSGVTNETINVDSAQYQFYNKGGPPDLKYGLVNATEAEQAELKRLETKMSDLTDQINSLINTDNSNTNITETQADKNLQGLDDYQTEYEQTTGTIDKLNSTKDTSKESFTNYGYIADNNMNKILQDSDIIVLQKNSEYLLWTILATGSIIVAMNITKQ